MHPITKLRIEVDASQRRYLKRVAVLAKKIGGEPVFSSEWQIGDVYRDEKGSLIYLTGGSYMGAYGVSNHWTWRIVNKDGTLGNIETGYGGVFFTAPDYRVEIRIRKVKEV